MRPKEAARMVATVFFFACGVGVVSHVLFKLLANRLYELDIMFVVLLAIAAYSALTSLVFVSRRPLTQRQFTYRVIINCVLMAVLPLTVCITDAFGFNIMEHPWFGRLLFVTLYACCYAAFAVLLLSRNFDNNRMQEMNAALDRYKGTENTPFPRE